MPVLATRNGMKRIIFSLVIVLMLVMVALLVINLPPAEAQPATWPTTWTGLSTDPDESGGKDHRDVFDTNGDGYALYYTADSQYLYLRMETVDPPGWPSTGPQGEARYKWWFNTGGTAAYLSGTTVYNAEFQLMLEDRTDTSNNDGSRDRLGELTLMDDLQNVGFTARWNQGNKGWYITNTRDNDGPSSLWKRALGTGTAGTGGPQGVMGSGIGYRIDDATTGGHFVDMYVSWAALGNPSSLCLIWATDNHDSNLNQAPNLDRPEGTSCLPVCVPLNANFYASNTTPCVNNIITFSDNSTGSPTSWSWTFGDGGMSTVQNATHSYTSAGTYTVSLNTSNGCFSDILTRTNYITVTPCTTYYKDADADTYGVTGDTQCLCAPTGQYTATRDGDCDDTNATVHPGATEVCNGIDDNCNGQIDEGVKTTYYQDADGDGYGNPAVSTQACSQPSGYVLDNTDCNDNDANEHPGQIWYKDADNDGYSDGTNTTACARPTGYKLASELTATSGDCDDTNAAVNPGATEICGNSIDDNCNGQVDEGVQTTYYQDNDSDGYGNATATTQACSQPQGYVLNNTDCNDSDANEHPGQIWYKDADNDGYSDGTNTTSCTRPTGYKIASELTATSGDCDDTNAAVNPDVTEICGNGIDDNCNGEIDENCLDRPILTITKSASPNPIEPGGTLTYNITVTNTGSANATGVTVVDDYNETILNITDADGGINDGDTITWDGGITIPAGEQFSYTVTATVSSTARRGSAFYNTANVTCAEEVSDFTPPIPTTVATRYYPSVGGCPPMRYLTVDWNGNINKKPLYNSNGRLAVDLLMLSPDGRYSLLLERGTLAPIVDGKRYYLITIRELELEDIPPLPENTEAIVAVNITPSGAVFDRDILLTLGLNQTQFPDNVLNVTIDYYDDVNGVWIPLESTQSEQGGVPTISTSINHFSIYGVLVKLASTPPTPAHFVASGLSIVPSVEKIWEPITFVTKTGESVTVTANVANDGGQSGNYTVELKLNGETVDTRTVTLGAGQNQQVSFIRSGLDYGQYEVNVAGLSGTFAASRTITWWLIILIIVTIGLIIWGVVWGRRRGRKAHQET
jgi:PKD repeat protein